MIKAIHRIKTIAPHAFAPSRVPWSVPKAGPSKPYARRKLFLRRVPLLVGIAGFLELVTVPIHASSTVR